MEKAAQSVRALAAQPDIGNFFKQRLIRYEEELRAAVERLADCRYRIVFSSAIAAGKSTAICRAEGAEIEEQGMPVPVLETGGGGITLCKVHIRQGPDYGILIEPCSDDGVRRHVLDFARSLLDTSQEADEEPAKSNRDAVEPSREIDRTLRNMAELPVHRFGRKSDGASPPSVDEARLLAERTGDVKALAVEILAGMKLYRRDRRVLWHDASTEQTPLV